MKFIKTNEWKDDMGNLHGFKVLLFLVLTLASHLTLAGLIKYEVTGTDLSGGKSSGYYLFEDAESVITNGGSLSSYLSGWSFEWTDGLATYGLDDKTSTAISFTFDVLAGGDIRFVTSCFVSTGSACSLQGHAVFIGNWSHSTLNNWQGSTSTSSLVGIDRNNTQLRFSDPTPVPVPATLTLFCLGLAGLFWLKRNKQIIDTSS